MEKEEAKEEEEEAEEKSEEERKQVAFLSSRIKIGLRD